PASASIYTLSLHDALPIFTVINGTGSFQRTTISVTAPRSWTTELMDLSTLLAPAGTYTVRIDLRVAIDTHLATDLRLEVDNVTRSEEHTSELQSRFDLVCR